MVGAVVTMAYDNADELASDCLLNVVIGYFNASGNLCTRRKQSHVHGSSQSRLPASAQPSAPRKLRHAVCTCAFCHEHVTTELPCNMPRQWCFAVCSPDACMQSWQRGLSKHAAVCAKKQRSHTPNENNGRTWRLLRPDKTSPRVTQHQQNRGTEWFAARKQPAAFPSSRALQKKLSRCAYLTTGAGWPGTG